MATGFMAVLRLAGKGVHFTLAAFCLLLSSALTAQEVGLAGIIGSKALLKINGGAPRAVPVGATVDGVKVVSVQGEQVVVEINGRKRPLKVGQNAVGVAASSDSDRLVLQADGQGHFFTTGTINGVSVRFLVDTGASMISLGASDARRMGLDFNRGQKGISQTANGQVVVSKIQLDNVRIGGMTLHQVDAVIHQTDLPIALLGMSVLNRMEMQRDGSTMTLKRRF
ncbi:retropepsin-like aspartic protease family protein [Azonexus hydrophilus]|uniref:retropepsin-like aspartic protease family protein n=1 Tax=Azonexus hydrophilus TaxID=418702 RepID=UPI0009DE9B79|nr:TIGR02281 family clan AA aspartic protease [Azonexus hydrophilus]